MARRQVAWARVLVVGLLAVLVVGCFQPWPANTVIVVNRSGVDLEIRLASGQFEPRELLDFGPMRSYPVPHGKRCMDDTLSFYDEAGELRATWTNPCGGRHAIQAEDLDPPPDDS